MKNKDLISVLENLPPDTEIVAEVRNIATGELLATTYDIGYSLNEHRELKLHIALETPPFLLG